MTDAHSNASTRTDASTRREATDAPSPSDPSSATNHRRRTSAPTDREFASPNRRLRWGSNLVALAGLFTIAHGLLFLYRTYFTPGFEAGVATLDGLTHAELAATQPEVASYVTHVHVTLVGLFVAIGVAVAALAIFGIRRGQRWAWTAALVVPLLFLVPSLGVHQTVAFSFHTLVHLGPAAVGAPLLVGGLVIAHRGLAEATSRE